MKRENKIVSFSFCYIFAWRRIMGSIDSILTSVKKDLGIVEAYEHFDPELIMDINAAFMVLNQLGVGPDEGFSITDKSQVWTDFMDEGPILCMVRKYVPLKVKLMFDTSTMTSPMIDVVNKQIAEFEWRLNVAVDPKKKLKE